jgi:pimeloyl-ACP methyl ester carboxylesterase
MERLGIYRGKLFAQNSEVAKDAWSFDAFTQIPEIQIPVYFLAGVYDYTCCYSLQKEYYEQLIAPSKGFYTFQESAHSPLFEEPEKGLHIMIEDVKQRKTELAD